MSEAPSAMIPILTDEELAEWQERSDEGHWLPWDKTSRLIAALRAGRAEVVELQDAVVERDEALAEVERLRGYIKANPMRACYEEAEGERDALQVEVEAVRADRDSWKRMYEIAKERADRCEDEVRG